MDSERIRHIQRVEYHGIRATDPQGRVGLRNPERGFRTETLIAETIGKNCWGPAHHLKDRVSLGYSEDWWMLDVDRYEPFGLTLAQTYCYLDEFTEGPISEHKIAVLEECLDWFRKRGMKVLLRFAYERRMNRKGGATLKRVLQHLDQLKPVIQKNIDIIFVMQAGFVGAWGEWHNSTHHLEKDHAALAEIIKNILETLPPERSTQVRVPKYKKWVLPKRYKDRELGEEDAHTDQPIARIGFHDDGFLAEGTDGGTWPEPPHYANPNNPEFDYMTRESPYLPIDGELFWADQGGKVNGLDAAKRLWLHHYTSFSLAHSYSEREGKPYSIDDWMHTDITQDQAVRTGLPISQDYFKDGQGREVKRTVFEYIRDHLGYRLEAQRALFPKTITPGDKFHFEIELINRGFSVPHNPRPVILTLIREEEMVKKPIQNADPRTWQSQKPGEDTDNSYEPLVHVIRTSFIMPQATPGWFKIGLWLPDQLKNLQKDPRYAIRLANRDIPWWKNASNQYGVNILGITKIQSPSTVTNL
jgi:hypothetical protein